MHTIETPFGKPGFLVLAGSRMFGIDMPESDYDYLGATIEPERYRLGLKSYKGQQGFEQYEFSGDKYEGSVYSLWKMASMLGKGNPTIITTMFADPIRDDYGICTPEFRSIVSCRQSGKRFMKYMESQRKAMTGERKATNRPDLIKAWGFDSKFAGHWIRLGYQGCEFLETGNITLPLAPESAQKVREIREGFWMLEDIISLGDALQARLDRAYDGTALQDEADWCALSEWVVEAYRSAYSLTNA
jgi:hypothetical protein